MLKKVVAVVIVMSLLSGMPVYAAETEARVYVDNKEVVSDPPAIIKDSATFIPFRAILNALGVTDDEITWNQETSSLEIRTGEQYIFMAIGNQGVIVDKSMKTLTVAPFIYENRTYIPLRAISEILGAGVEWNGSKKEVYITTAD